jgi:RNA polymerase sigma-B factor
MGSLAAMARGGQQQRSKLDASPTGGRPRDNAARDAHERQLFGRLRDAGDPGARAQLVELFLPLSRSLALRYVHSGEPLDDLVQVANLGLVKAVDRFDVNRGVSFTSYAVPTILGELKRYFRDTTWAIHVPRELQERAAAVDRTTDRLFAQMGRAPSVAQLAEVCGLSADQVLEARDASMSYRATSLEAPAGSDEEDDFTVADRLGDEDGQLARAEHAVMLGQLSQVLSRRDCEVLILRFHADLTQSEIAARIGVSQMHVSRILRSALERLRLSAGGG